MSDERALDVDYRKIPKGLQLHAAALYNDAEIIAAMISDDETACQKRNDAGCTPLHLAAKEGHAGAVELLLLGDASAANAADWEGETPLHYAAAQGHVQVLEMLLDHRADIYMKNLYGETPEVVAEQCEKPDTVKILQDEPTSTRHQKFREELLAYHAKLEEYEKQMAEYERKMEELNESAKGEAQRKQMEQYNQLRERHERAGASAAVVFTGIDFEQETLAEATNSFSDTTNLLGHGTFGKVYKGVLRDGTEVAVKVLSAYSQDSEREFRSEIAALGQYRHPHLLGLIGTCLGGGGTESRILVYDIMPNGDVRGALDKGTPLLAWADRQRLLMEAVSGLLYLHTARMPPLLHLDFKADNILLSASLTAKVADFGLSRAVPQLMVQSHHKSSMICGTPGYVCPMFMQHGIVSVKSDVYSVGIVILEILTGLPVISSTRPQPYLKFIVEDEFAQRGTIAHLVDARAHTLSPTTDCLGALWPTTAIGQLARLAWVCTRDNSDERPLLVHVLNELRLLNRTTGVEKKKTLSPTQSVADGAGALGRKVSVRAGTLDWKSVRKDTKAWE